MSRTFSSSPRDASFAYASSYHRPFFVSPEPAGRKITAGFTYLQRISKAATYDVWFPERLRQNLDTRIAAGQAIGPQQFPAQWAAVRQFELLHESGNHKIYDLDPSNIQRATLDLSRSMRAGGYRVTVATIGSYAESAAGDELEILDRDLQERIAQMIHMLYLDEPSAQISADNQARLAADKWNYLTALPHVGMVLGAQDLFAREEEGKRGGRKGKKGGAGDTRWLRHRRARRFFDILGALPSNHMIHDTAVGLQLPELNGVHQWNYIASPDETLAAFNRVLGDLFDKFNGISLSRLNGHEDAHAEVRASTYHLRGYGDRMTESSEGFYRLASLALN